MPTHVLEHRYGRLKYREHVSYIRPKVAPVLGAFAPTCEREGLARISARDDVHRLDSGPVDGGDVAEVGHVGVAVGEHFGRAGGGVGDPCE